MRASSFALSTLSRLSVTSSTTADGTSASTAPMKPRICG
jgi:hypothetical protein